MGLLSYKIWMSRYIIIHGLDPKMPLLFIDFAGWCLWIDQAIINFMTGVLPWYHYFWTGLPQNIYQDHLILSKAIYKLWNSNNDSKKTTLYELLERCQSLPAELLAIIWDFITPCTVRCLLSLSATENMWQTSSSAADSGTMSLHGNISVYHTCVLDGTYICGIRQGNKFYGHESSTFSNISIPLSNTAFVLRFGMYGLWSIDFVLDTNTNPSSKSDILVKDNEFISIIHYQHEVDLEWDVWHP